jgi:5-methylphenazine-1-carboxylate 1-monooxygenase
MKVLIVGAGIGGLTTALSLHAAGAEVVVVDAVRALSPLGVGINLQPHAVRELTELGLGDALEATGIPTREMLRLDRHANRIVGHDRGRFAGYAWPQYSIHRGDLQMLLLDVVVDRLGPGAVRTGWCAGPPARRCPRRR